MKLLSSFTVMQLAIGIFSLRAAANSGYAETCNSIRLFPADQYDSYWFISADCREPSGEYFVGTTININSCFANYNGGLAAALKYEYNTYLFNL